MPQRFLRPGIRTSDNWNACSWKAQSLYIRLITLVDDYGRYDGRTAIIHGECFALRSDIKPQETAALVGELSNKKLVVIYEVDSKKYLQLLKWQERTRGESKYPDPNLGQTLTNPAESCGILPPSPSPLAISHKPVPQEVLLESFIFPESMKSELFLSEFKMWVNYRMKLKKPVGGNWKDFFQAQLDNFSKYGEEKSIIAMERARINGWTAANPDWVRPNPQSEKPTITQADKRRSPVDIMKDQAKKSGFEL